jgi:spermidine synthase
VSADAERPPLDERIDLLFFGSGAAALLYQTVWARALQDVIGTTAGAIATVFAATMAGLAAGGWFGGRVAPRLARPLRTWAALEFAIGAWGALFPTLMPGARSLHVALGAAGLGPVAGQLARFLWVFCALLPATLAMGATLPVLARDAGARSGAENGGRLGRLYAANTAGAVLGAGVAGLVLLPWLGLTAAGRCAVALNVALGCVAVAIARETQPLPRTRWAPPAGFADWLWAIAAGGFSGLVVEVAWTRLLALVLGPSVYGFAVILVSTLAGLALGGWIGRWAADPIARRGWGREAVTACRLGAAVSAWGMLYTSNQLPYWYVWIFDAIGGADDPWLGFAGCLLLACGLLFPTMICSGASFPIAVRAAEPRSDGLGPATGALAAASSLGGAVGAALAGFWMLPTLTVVGSVQCAATLDVLGAAGLLARARPRAALALGAGVISVVWVARPPWDPATLTAGTYLYLSRFSDHSREGIRTFTVAERLLYYREGPTAVVTVGENPETGHRWLATNGKIDASSEGDRGTQILVGLLPFQFAPTPDDVLVIGLASGMTAGAALQAPGVRHLDVVEIEPAMAEAAAWFAPYNFGALDDPRLELSFDDARSLLLQRPLGTYEVVISEPSNPWIAGVASLFTTEFLTFGKARLAPGGVWAQWIQVYGLDVNALRTLLATFADVYPHVAVFGIDEMADLVVIGSDRPLRADASTLSALFGAPGARDALDLAGVHLPDDLLALRQLDTAAIAAMTAGAVRNTDDNVRIEYLAPLRMHRDTTLANLAMLRHHAHLPTDVPEDPLAWADLAFALEQRRDPRAAAAWTRAIRLLPPEDPLAATWSDAAGLSPPRDPGDAATP